MLSRVINTVAQIITTASIIISLGGNLHGQMADPVPSNPKSIPSAVVSCAISNGDRVSGSALAVYVHNVTIETEYLGPVSVPYSVLLSCESSDPVMKERISQISAFTKVDPGVASNTTEPSIPVSKAAEEQPAHPAAAVAKQEEHWKRNLTFNYTFSQGNANISDLNLSGGIDRTDQNGRFLVTGFVRRGKRDGSDFANLFIGTVRYERKLHPDLQSEARASYFSELGYEQDRMNKLNHRLAWNGGIKTLLHKDSAEELAVDLGGGVTSEFYSSGIDRMLGAGLLRLNYDREIFKNARILQQIAVFPDFADVGRYRLQAEASFRAPVTKILSLQLGVLNRFDSKPQEVVKHNDFSVLTGFSFEF